ncbi:hypothetical protein D9615_009738 [Tricholomella constricta]|uniref:Nucleoporin Nup159/Nup146 N-terminal domain-containing protein n=1 Tax=Tricholomella constricta TaxID=117010 RepID=A0A8H5GSY2_9AGAR|nr:hypothetical protein D9615_009738 [Tricholomella constricta]
MEGFTRLIPPQPAQVTIDPTAKECLSEGFNYPTFRLINKQERVKLSSKAIEPEATTFYNLLAIANAKGWFVAATVQADGSYALIFSPLADLRAAFKAAKGNDGTFMPKRILSLHSAKPSFITLAFNDTRLLVCVGRGELLVFDTATLFSAGNDAVVPINKLPSDSGPIRHIVPNPGTEPNLVDLVAVVNSNKTVVLYNTKLEIQGGWIASSPDDDSAPATVAWSPKGKHIAIGLQGGHILTYSLTNKSTIHKHIPPTARPPLVSLNWLSPGHTFRTSYAASQAHGTMDPTQHIICVDAKAPTATYYAPAHPFPLPERLTQSFTLALPKWDEEAGTAESKSLVVVGDRVSVDLEVLGSLGTQWYQQSQENPLSLPLDSNMEDTLLLALGADLTDSEASAPIMLAYLNDGTVQAWYVEHSKPYLGMVTPQSVTAPFATAAPSAFAQPAATAVSAPTQQSTFGQSGFGQASTPSAFGQPSFGQSAAFGQTHSPPAFGSSGFGQQQTASAFGQAAPVATSAFGQTSSPSAFGGGTTTSPFGQPQGTSAFGQPSAFGSGGSTSAFGSSTTGDGPSTGAFGGGGTTGAFGSSSSLSSFGGGPSTNAFGGGGAFGSSSTNNAFGGGAFGALSTDSSTKNAFGQASFGFGSSAPSSAAAPVPDMTREASMSDSTPSLSGMGLGEPNDPSKPMKSGGIFGSSPSTSMSTTTTPSFGGGPIKPASGFGAFNNLPSAQAATPTTSEQKPVNRQPETPAFSTASKPASAFGQSAFGASSFGQPAFGQSAFVKPAVPASTTNPVSGGFGAFAATPTPFSGAAAQQGASTGSAFGSATKATSPSTGGFGAFASSAPSAFGSAAATQTSSTSPAPATGFETFAQKSPSPFGNASPQGAPATSPFMAGAPQSKSPFGSGGSTDSAFGTTGFGVSPFGPQPGARAISPFEKEQSAFKTPVKPAALAGSPSSSPESTPRLGKATIVSDNDSPPAPAVHKAPATPTSSSPFGSLIAPSSGAFGNIQTSPSVFKPASGFGAFGSDNAPASSPFFKTPAEPKSPPISAFPTALAQSPSAKTTTTTPTSLAFGASSPLGGVRSAFTPATAPPPPAKAPATGGFGAFSGSSTGFGAFSGPKKSFGELLKVGDNDTTDPVKPKTGTASEPPKPVSAFPPIAKGAPVSVFSPPAPKQEGAEKKREEPSAGGSREEKGKEVERHDKLSENASFGNLSLLSDASSFAEVEHEESDENDLPSGSEDAEGEAHVDYDEEGSFLSDESEEEGELTSESEESSQLSDVPEEEEELEEGEGPGVTATDPTVVPLPESRSTSATPQPEVPKIKVTPSPPPEPVLEKIKEESTTPPGTPTKEPSPPLTRPSSTPAPAPTTSFGLGLGRPSTRPTRSSPLASVPVSLADDDEAPPSPAKPPASPKPGYSPLPMEVPLRPESEDDKASSPKPPRPQTPPLLSAFGPQKSDAVPAIPATPPTPSTPAQPVSTTPATPPFSLFGKFKPPTTGTPSDTETATSPPEKAPAAPQNIFGSSMKPLANATLPKPVTAPVPAPPPTGFGLFGSLPQPSTGVTKPAVPPTGQPAPFNLGGFSLKGKAPEVDSPLSPPPMSSTKPPTPAIFGSGPAASPFTLAGKGKETSMPPPSLFPSTTTSTAATATTSPPFDLSGFGQKGKAFTTPAPAHQAPGTPPPFDLSGFSLKGKQPAAAGAATPSQTAAVQGPTEAGMQRECMLVANSVNEDLASLGRLAEQRKKQLQIIKTRLGGRQRADLFDAKKWSPAGAVMFGEVLVQFEKDFDELRDIRDAQRQMIRELQSSMLKANTRKEEINRFNKAKSDKEFARMLKARTLGPEHLETQTQLRRNIRAMRDRVQKLEDHLKASKKKLMQVKTGQPGLRAPSLDTINRTYRNIDLAIQQQSADVALLKRRISKLHLSTPSKSLSPGSSSRSSTPARDARLPDPAARPYNVTPNVAITTAAALNAERAAHKLKRALLAVRKEPLLNTRAASASPAPLSFGTPQKSSPSPPPTTDFFKFPPSTPLFPTTPTPTEGPPPPAWNVPPDDSSFSPSSSPPAGRRGATAGMKKHNIIPLKKNAGGATPPPPPSTFSWGPLPTFDFDSKGESFTMVEAVKLTSPGKGFGSKP